MTGVQTCALPICPATYTYTGNDFTFFNAPYTGSDSVTGSVTFASALSSVGSFHGFTATAFSFSDGVQTITDATPGVGSTFDFKTDASGTIIGWEIVVDIGSVLADNITTQNGPAGIFDSGEINNDNSSGTIFRDPGTWVSSLSSTSVPEPATISLFCAGLAGLGMMRRRQAA